MCINIEYAHSDEEMFGIAEDTLKNPMKWIGIATVSQILHCLKPTVFPILNGRTEELGFSHDVSEYVENTRKLKILRDEKFSFKNYRVIDLWLWEDNPEDDLETTLTVSPNPKETPRSPQKSLQPLNQILYGPPGTGKTYHTINYALSVIEGKSIEELENEERNNLKKRFDDYTERWQIVFTTFHQSFSYEDFIEGLRADVDGNGNIKYKVKDGIFKELAEKACKYPDRPHILIIDEINRGNISKIFGELITLIEESKRWWNDEHISLKLPYSGKLFSVPNNLYIIGTMNTTDRSIALIDTALRRRFDFVEMAPNSELLSDIKLKDTDEKELEISIKGMFEIMNERIKFFLDRDHCIGHAYFLPLRDTPTLEELNKIFQKSIIPLLQEYFYDDGERIQYILGDHDDQWWKKKGEKIYQDRDLKNDFLWNKRNDYEDKKVYSMNVYPTEESYIKIYNPSYVSHTENHEESASH